MLKIRKTELLKKIYLYSLKFKEDADKYLWSRGIIIKNPVSYLPLTKTSVLKKEIDFSREELSELGFLNSNSHYLSLFGLLIPHFDSYNNISSMTFRLPKTSKYNQRYINTKGGIDIPFGLNMVNFDEDVFIFEGAVDCLSAIQMGVNNSISVSSCHIPKKMYPCLKRFNKKIILCFDPDEAGIKGMVETYKTMKNSGFNNVFIKVLSIPDPLKDINDCLKHNIKWDTLKNMVSQPVVIEQKKEIKPLDNSLRDYYNKKVNLKKIIPVMCVKDNRHYKCPFPGHGGEANGSLYLYPDGGFYCYGCRKGGFAWEFAKSMTQSNEPSKIEAYLKELLNEEIHTNP